MVHVTTRHMGEPMPMRMDVAVGMLAETRQSQRLEHASRKLGSSWATFWLGF